VSLFPVDEAELHNHQYIVLEIDEVQTQISRDLMVKILHAENVIARRYFYPGCHRMEPYRSYFPHAGLLLPETEKLTHNVLVLPTGTAITHEEIKQICQIIQLAIDCQVKIREKMTQCLQKI
jgi:dTDP-4-amino-4,6-dideoxygalactose transaminase